MNPIRSVPSVLVRPHPHSPHVCVVFSCRFQAAGTFTYFRKTLDLFATTILVNDHSHGWYLSGTPDFESEEALIETLRGHIQAWRGPGGHVYTLGSSMGGYAALRFGAALGAGKILALCPESHLGIPFGKSIESLPDLKEGEHDIAGLNYASNAQVLIVSGSNDIVDVYCAARFVQHQPGFEVKILNNVGHVVAEHLDETMGLVKIFKDFFDEGRTDLLSGADLADLPDGDTAAALKRFSEALRLRQPPQPHDAVLVEAEAARQPNCSGFQYLAGMAALGRRDELAAEQCFRRAIAVARLPRAVLRLAQMLAARGDHEACVRLIDAARAPLQWSLLKTQFESLLALGRFHEAARLLGRTDVVARPLDQWARLRARLRRAWLVRPASCVIDGIAGLESLGVAAAGLMMRNSVLRVPALLNSALELGPHVALVGLDMTLVPGGRVSIGAGCLIQGRIHIERGGSLFIADHVCLDDGVRIHVPAGAQVQIGRLSRLQGCLIGTESACEFWRHGEQAPRDIRIGAQCLVQAGARVEPGAQVPKGSVIAAGSVFSTQETSACAEWQGHPAQAVRHRVAWRLGGNPEAGSAGLLKRFGGPLSSAQAADFEWVAGHVRAHLAEVAEPSAKHYAMHYYAARALYEVDHLARSTDFDPAMPFLEAAALRDVFALCNARSDDRNRFCCAYEVAARALAGDTADQQQRSADLLARWPDIRTQLTKLAPAQKRGHKLAEALEPPVKAPVGAQAELAEP